MSYTEIARALPFEGAPKINNADVIGASRGRPVLVRIAVTGERPISYSAEGLPEGLILDGCIISGKVMSDGDYKFKLRAENALGSYEKDVTLEVRERSILITPLLGFTSWNAFGHLVSQEKIEHTAEKMLELGITEYGYAYVNTDSGWQGEYGGKFDAIMPNKAFPDMKGMCDKLHSLGLKAGIYANPMRYAYGYPLDFDPVPPGVTEGEPDIRFNDEKGGIGLIRKEKNNALQWAKWGFDYLKYDWNPSDPYNAEAMRRELIATDRDFGLCISLKALPEYHAYWSKYPSSYRCNPDSICTWSSFMGIYRSFFNFMEYGNRGHYFDLDMLDLGKCHMFDIYNFPDLPDYGFTEDEAIMVYSTRAFLNSPIQISCDLDYLDEFLLSVYCNDEIIAINQDSLCDTARPVTIIERGDAILHVWKRRLCDGSFAFAVFNLGKTTEEVKIMLDGESLVRDVWAKRDLGTMNVIKESVVSHTVRIYKATPKN